MQQALGQPKGRGSQPFISKDGMDHGEVLETGIEGSPTTLTPLQRKIVENWRKAIAWVENHPRPPGEAEINYKDIVW